MSDHMSPTSSGDEPTAITPPAAPGEGQPTGPPTTPTGSMPTSPPPGYPAGPPTASLPTSPPPGYPADPPGFGYGYGWGVGAPGSAPPAGYPGVWPAGGSSGAGVPTSGRSKRTGVLAGVGTVAVLVALLAGAGLGHTVWPKGTVVSATSQAPSSGAAGGLSPFGSGSSGSPTAPGAGAPSGVAAIAAKVDPGLVDINTNLSYENAQAAGTGMVLTPDGRILTNNHVIDGATSISVTDVGNGKTYKANVVGYDRTSDVAVIQLVNASGLTTITPASTAPTIGQPVVGVGNAGGAGGTPSTAGGSITALNQSITASDSNGGNAESLTGLIETNAAIEPGDSGGSLTSTSGQVIGMDTAASTGSGYQITSSQGYAIAIGTALGLEKKIVAGDASSTIHIGATGFLGVSVQSSSVGAGSPGSGGLGNGIGGTPTGGGGTSTSNSGAIVVGTLPGSPASAAGLVQNDVITGVNGKTVTSSGSLTNDLNVFHPGDTVQLTWTTASGQSQTAGIKLTTGPPA